MTELHQDHLTELSLEIYNKITKDLDFSITEVNPDNFELPADILELLKNKPTKVDEKLLTERKVDGSGVFDGIMAAIKAHLKEEFQANRITGAEYTKAYVALVSGALQSAVQYCLQKDSSYWNAVNAQIGALTAQIQYEKAKLELALAQGNVLNNKAEYAVKVAQLGKLEAEYDAVEEQVKQVKYQTEFILPKQVDQMSAGIAQSTAQTSQISEQTKQIKYQTESGLPAQTALTNAQTAVQNQQVGLLKEQTEQAHAQVSDTQLDGKTPVTGHTGNQNALLKQQVVSFQKDSLIKSAKIYADSLATQMSMSVANAQGTGLDPTSIGTAMSKLATSMNS